MASSTGSEFVTQSHGILEISAFNGAPEFAHGIVRDVRIRWACEEIGRPYRTRLLDAAASRPASYFEAQPFGQVPAFWEGDLQMFESGAILLHLGESDERLLPREPKGRARALSWLFAALNSVEPPLTFLAFIDFFSGGAEWAKQGRPMIEGFAQLRLHQLSQHLGDREWLDDRFSLADLIVISVLRTVRHTDLVGRFPNLASYLARGEARPAFARAIAAHLADFGGEPYHW